MAAAFTLEQRAKRMRMFRSIAGVQFLIAGALAIGFHHRAYESIMAAVFAGSAVFYSVLAFVEARRVKQMRAG